VSGGFGVRRFPFLTSPPHIEREPRTQGEEELRGHSITKFRTTGQQRVSDPCHCTGPPGRRHNESNGPRLRYAPNWNPFASSVWSDGTQTTRGGGLDHHEDRSMVPHQLLAYIHLQIGALNAGLAARMAVRIHFVNVGATVW
jgi:hypothetical protein